MLLSDDVIELKRKSNRPFRNSAVLARSSRKFSDLVFEPLIQASASPVHSFEGLSGLGLHDCQQVAHANEVV